MINKYAHKVRHVVLSTIIFHVPSRLLHSQAHRQPLPLLWSTSSTSQSWRLKGSRREYCAMRPGGRRRKRHVGRTAIPPPRHRRLAARVICITHFRFAVRTATDACLGLSPLPLRCNTDRGPWGRARYHHRSGLLRRRSRYGDDTTLHHDVRGPVGGRRAACRRPTVRGTLAGLR